MDNNFPEQKIKRNDKHDQQKAKNSFTFDFLLLSHSGFNGIIRFNKKGAFNIPFAKNKMDFPPRIAI